MFGHEKVDEQVDRLTQRYQVRVRLDQQGRASVSAGLDLIAIDSDDQVGAWGSGDRWCLPPTPARAEISRIGALTPEQRRQRRPRTSNACSFLNASARLRRIGTDALLLPSDTSTTWALGGGPRSQARHEPRMPRRNPLDR